MKMSKTQRASDPRGEGLRRLWLLTPLLLILSAVSCGDDGPTDPPDPTYPQVAGTYTGPVTMSGDMLGFTVTGTMNLSVTQSEADITISGTMTFLGKVSLFPAIPGKISEAGLFTPTNKEDSFEIEMDDDCGVTIGTSAFTFSSSTMQVRVSLSTEHCGDLLIASDLNKQAGN